MSRIQELSPCYPPIPSKNKLTLNGICINIFSKARVMKENMFYNFKWKIFLICILILSGILFSEIKSGKYICVDALDGDTIWIMIEGRKTKIKIDGIDCPEMGQDFGRNAKQFTSDLVVGKIVEVNIKGVDKTKTAAAFVLIDKKDIGLALLRAGLAWNYKQYASDDPVYALIEEDAKKEKIGLWSMTNPISPWEFRRNAFDLIENDSTKLLSIPTAKAPPPIVQNQNSQPENNQQISQSSEYDKKREMGLQRFEEVIRELAKKAEEMRTQYTRYSESCFGWQSRTVECLKMWSDYLRLREDIKTSLKFAKEYARKAGVYPGQMREICERYNLDWSGWD
jgi:micrococcal nuclease